MANSPNEYAVAICSILNKTERDDVKKSLLVLVSDLVVLPTFVEALLELHSLDESLPLSCFAKQINSGDEGVKMAALYNVTRLLCVSEDTRAEPYLETIFDTLCCKLLSSTNTHLTLFSIQLVKELLSVKKYRQVFWKNHSSFFPPVYAAFQENKMDLQKKYYSVLSIWLLTFEPTISKEMPILYSDISGSLLTHAKESVKEKIVRLCVSSILNFISVDKNEFILKHLLIIKGLDTMSQISNRKWADEELKEDVAKVLEILHDAVVNLTTFDEYENEVKIKKLAWSPCHKNEEFWIDNAHNFKEGNWKFLDRLLKLLEFDADENDTKKSKHQFQNQAIVCHDVQQLVKQLPEVVKHLEKTGAKNKLMILMNSSDPTVKYEALKTTQVLISHSFD